MHFPEMHLQVINKLFIRYVWKYWPRAPLKPFYYVVACFQVSYSCLLSTCFTNEPVPFVFITPPHYINYFLLFFTCLLLLRNSSVVCSVAELSEILHIWVAIVWFDEYELLDSLQHYISQSVKHTQWRKSCEKKDCVYNTSNNKPGTELTPEPI